MSKKLFLHSKGVPSMDLSLSLSSGPSRYQNDNEEMMATSSSASVLASHDARSDELGQVACNQQQRTSSLLLSGAGEQQQQQQHQHQHHQHHPPGPRSLRLKETDVVFGTKGNGRNQLFLKELQRQSLRYQNMSKGAKMSLIQSIIRDWPGNFYIWTGGSGSGVTLAKSTKGHYATGSGSRPSPGSTFEERLTLIKAAATTNDSTDPSDGSTSSSNDDHRSLRLYTSVRRMMNYVITKYRTQDHGTATTSNTSMNTKTAATATASAAVATAPSPGVTGTTPGQSLAVPSRSGSISTTKGGAKKLTTTKKKKIKTKDQKIKNSVVGLKSSHKTNPESSSSHAVAPTKSVQSQLGSGPSNVKKRRNSKSSTTSTVKKSQKTKSVLLAQPKKKNVVKKTSTSMMSKRRVAHPTTDAGVDVTMTPVAALGGTSTLKIVAPPPPPFQPSPSIMMTESPSHHHIVMSPTTTTPYGEIVVGSGNGVRGFGDSNSLNVLPSPATMMIVSPEPSPRGILHPSFTTTTPVVDHHRYLSSMPMSSSPPTGSIPIDCSGGSSGKHKDTRCINEDNDDEEDNRRLCVLEELAVTTLASLCHRPGSLHPH